MYIYSFFFLSKHQEKNKKIFATLPAKSAPFCGRLVHALHSPCVFQEAQIFSLNS